MLQTVWDVGLAIAILWSGFGLYRHLGDPQRRALYGVLFAVAVALAGITAVR